MLSGAMVLIVKSTRLRWPSINDEQIMEALQAVTNRHQGKAITIVEFSEALFAELVTRHGPPK